MRSQVLRFTTDWFNVNRYHMPLNSVPKPLKYHAEITRLLTLSKNQHADLFLLYYLIAVSMANVKCLRTEIQVLVHSFLAN